MTVDPLLRPGTPCDTDAWSRPSPPSPTRYPRYSRGFADLSVGLAWAHPGERRLDAALGAAFAVATGETNPLYLAQDVARAHGFQGQLMPPLLVFNLVLGMSDWSDRSTVFRDVRFFRPAYAGDTVQAFSAVRDLSPAADGWGRAMIATWALNQNRQVLLRVDRELRIPAGRTGLPVELGLAMPSSELPLGLPLPLAPWPVGRTGPDSYWERFAVGQVRTHAGAAFVDASRWTLRLALHPVPPRGPVDAGLVLAWLAGRISPAVSENAFWDLGYGEALLHRPILAEEPLHAISRVVRVEPGGGPWGPRAGRVTVQVVGLRRQEAGEAWTRYGDALFGDPALGQPLPPPVVATVSRQLLLKKQSGCL